METMKRKWGKPVTEVQQFVPQEYCVVCRDEDDHVLYAIACGQGITAENGFPDWVTVYQSTTDGGVPVFGGDNTNDNTDPLGYWNHCHVTHTFTKEELDDIHAHIGRKNTQDPNQHAISAPGHLFGWRESAGAHIFYLTSIDGPGQYTKVHS